MLNPNEIIETLLLPKLGEDTYVDEPEQAFHPNAWSFYNERPNANFSGLSKSPMFETNLLLGEMDDDRQYRIERVGEVLVFVQFDADNDGTFHAAGQAIVCEPGSDAEKVFVMQALGEVMDAAAEPLSSAMAEMRAKGLHLSHDHQAALRTRIFAS